MAGQGRATSGVGFTARDQLSRELGAGAREIETLATESKAKVKEGYESDITSADDRRNAEMARISGMRDTALMGYYEQSVEDRGTTGTSEGSLHTAYESALTAPETARQNALVAAASERDLKLGRLEEQREEGRYGKQFDLEEDVEKEQKTWETASTNLQKILEGYGATAGKWGEAFELRSTAAGQTIKEQAEESISTDIMDLQEGFMVEKEVGLDPFTESLFDVSPITGLAGLGESYDPNTGMFGAEWTTGVDKWEPLAGIGLTDTGLYEPPTTADWLYDPASITLPWAEETDWDPKKPLGV